MSFTQNKLLAIIGHPIGHSLSPLMHNTALHALGLDYDYRPIDIEPSQLKQGIQDLITQGIVGFNVTIPHKQSVIPFLHEISDEARTIGAVNTIVVRDGRLHGYNTDVYGVSKSLEPHAARLEGKNVVILGAGGAARAVLFCLLNQFKPAGISLATRSIERGKELAGSFGQKHSITVLSLPDPSLHQLVTEATFVVNATPAGMTPNVSASPLPTTIAFHRDQIVFDLIYTPMQTTLLKIAAAHGATTIDGLEMFLHQGAKAFELFTGKTMPLDEIRRVIEEKLRME